MVFFNSVKSSEHLDDHDSLQFSVISSFFPSLLLITYNPGRRVLRQRLQTIFFTTTIPSTSGNMPRKQHLSFLVAIALCAFIGITYVLSSRREADGPITAEFAAANQQALGVSDGILKGENKAAKIENATLKYVYDATSVWEMLIAIKGLN